MPPANIRASSTPNVMKSENGNDSVDTSSTQTIGREPFLSFSRAADSQIQWMQFLHSLDQPADIPGWPLLSPLKVQMQKCDKCSREFCSSINYRRHLRVHHRLKKLDKDTAKNRGLLAAFWDKLSPDEAKEIASFTNAILEEVPGSSLIKALTSLVYKPGFSPLPQGCLRAGSALLDIVQGRSRFPVSSQELFSILDGASENTFLCGMTAAVQKYVLDGEAGKICLETKNLVACSSFLLEQNLVKAWIADKDAEALRCQKLLVEEEEAAQKRQAAVLERRRQKKLRQKEQKAKDQKNVEQADVKESIQETLEAEPLAKTPSPSTASDSEIQSEDRQSENIPSALEPTCPPESDNDDDDDGTQSGLSNEHRVTGICDVGHENLQTDGCRRGVAQCQVPPKMQWGLPNANYASRGLNPGMTQKQGNQRDFTTASVVSGNKVWSRKSKPENDNYNMKTKAQKVVSCKLEECRSSEVLIGSIPVTLGNKRSVHNCTNLTSGKDDGIKKQQMEKDSVHIKVIKSDSIQSAVNRPALKLWRPVSRNGTKDQVPMQNSDMVPKSDTVTGKSNDQNTTGDVGIDGEAGCNALLEEDVHTDRGNMKVSVSAAKAFLKQRWKEAIDTDHVKLVLSAESDHIENDCHATETLSMDVNCIILGNAENHSVNIGSHEPSATGTHRAKFMKKHDKGVKIKYIPKHRTIC